MMIDGCGLYRWLFLIKVYPYSWDGDDLMRSVGTVVVVVVLLSQLLQLLVVSWEARRRVLDETRSHLYDRLSRS